MKNLKYFFKRFNFLKVYFSPFKIIKPKLYIGKIRYGTPYFFPRKWVKFKEQDIFEAVQKAKNNPNLVKKTDGKWYDHYKNYSKAIPKKIGFDFVSLGWKTKWGEHDYRHEWSPLWSFVFFQWQIVIMFVPEHQDHYWCCWLSYTKYTNKSLSVKERILEAKKKFPCIWTSYSKDEKKTICYWDYILKKKYGKQSNI